MEPRPKTKWEQDYDAGVESATIYEGRWFMPQEMTLNIMVTDEEAIWLKEERGSNLTEPLNKIDRNAPYVVRWTEEGYGVFNGITGEPVAGPTNDPVLMMKVCRNSNKRHELGLTVDWATGFADAIDMPEPSVVAGIRALIGAKKIRLPEALRPEDV